MGTLGWNVVLLICKQSPSNLPSDTHLYWLLMTFLDIHTQVEPSPACVPKGGLAGVLPP